MSAFKQCVSQYDAKNFYLFADTGIKVYSFEEMLYHCLNYWEQSIYDYINGNLEQWVLNELDLPHIASAMKSIRNSQLTLTDQYQKILLITDYYSYCDIENTIDKLLIWENRTQWEKLKEKGDLALRECRYKKAVTYYTEALNYVDEISIHNNLAITYSLMENYSEAEKILTDVLARYPENKKILLNLIELYKIQKDYTKIIELLSLVKNKDIPFIQIIYGDVKLLQGDDSEAVKYYTKAIKLGDDYLAYIKLAGICLENKDFIGARNMLDQCPNKNNSEYLLGSAKTYDLAGDSKLAIEKILQALTYENNDVESWIKLSQLYLKNNELRKAYNAISNAINLDSDNDEIQLTFAQINKAQNKIEDYQGILSKILNKWKNKYREKLKN